MKVETYLGDGVYATFDGEGIRLDLRAQPGFMEVTVIYLEPAVIDQLNRFHRKCIEMLEDSKNGKDT